MRTVWPVRCFVTPGSLVILKMLQMVRSGVVLQVVRCGPVWSGAVNSQTGCEVAVVHAGDIISPVQMHGSLQCAFVETTVILYFIILTSHILTRATA